MKESDIRKHQRALQKLGHSYSAIRSWIKRERRPNYETLIDISELIGKPVNSIVRWFIKSGHDK